MIKIKNSYLIIAHYHSEGIIRSDIVELIKHSSKYFEKIFLISTNLKKSEKKKLIKYATILIRPNYGYDFYSYKIGIELVLKNEKDFNDKGIFLINSSVLFLKPNKIIKELKKINMSKNTIYSLTKSWEIHEHLQTYFLFLPLKIFKNNIFYSWWKKIGKFKKRQKIINKYELGLFLLIKKLKINTKSLFKKNIDDYPINLLQKIILKIDNIFYKSKKIHKKNPCFFYWEEIFNKFGIIKIELIKTNPHNVDMRNLSKYFNKIEINKIKKLANNN